MASHQDGDDIDMYAEWADPAHTDQSGHYDNQYDLIRQNTDQTATEDRAVAVLVKLQESGNKAAQH